MKKTISPLLVCALFLALSSKGQPILSGPTCVVSGTTYQYLISGNWDSSSTMQICTTGATLLSTGTACTANATPVAAALLTWNDGIGTGTINVTSSNGNTSLSVSMTTPLRAGSIAAASKLQNIGFLRVLALIHCNPDTGGSCSPNYTHQWQQSFDTINWTDIGSSNGTDLVMAPSQQQTIFFRRKTVETVSGTVAYSDLASVLVGPPPPGTILSPVGAIAQ